MTTNTTMPAGSLFQLAEDQRLLAAEIQAAAEGLSSDDPGELSEAVARVEALLLADHENRDALLRKADAYCYLVGELRARAGARKSEAERLQALAGDDERQAQRLEDRLISVLTRLEPDVTRFELPQHRLSSRRSDAVVIDPDADLPEAYLTVRRVESPNRTSLKQALKAGMAFPGVRLEERRSWRIV